MTEMEKGAGTGAGAHGDTDMKHPFSWDNRVTLGNVLTFLAMIAAGMFLSADIGKGVAELKAANERQDMEIRNAREREDSRKSEAAQMTELRFQSLQAEIKSQADRQSLVNTQILASLSELKSQRK